MLNIVGKGMRSGNIQQDTSDMDGEATAKMALRYPGVIVGIKTAHFNGPEWKPGGAGGASPAPRPTFP